MLNDYCSDEELDNSILINSEIYLEIKGLLKAEAVLTNTIIIDTVHFKNIIKDKSYRMACFQKVSDSREMNGYLINFDERVNAYDHFITGLLDFINRQGIAGTALALDYL